MAGIDLDMVANTSYAILLASYVMRDILWLRVLTVISLSFELPYYYFQQDPLWDGISWDLAFILINVFWIARLGLDRRPVQFTPEQKRLWETALHRLRPRHARALFKHASHRLIAPKETISTRGRTLKEVALITEGKVELQLNGKKIDELGPGHFIGSAMFLERDLAFPSVTTVVATEPTHLMTWKIRELRALLKDDNELSTAVEATLSMEIASLLTKAYQREAFKT